MPLEIHVFPMKSLEKIGTHAYLFLYTGDPARYPAKYPAGYPARHLVGYIQPDIWLPGYLAGCRVGYLAGCPERLTRGFQGVSLEIPGSGPPLVKNRCLLS